MSIKVEITNNTRKVLDSIKADTALALLNKAEAIGYTAQILAPQATGALVNSKRVEAVSFDNVQVSFNTAYANRRHYENKKNPQTLEYLKRAGEIEGAKALL